MEQHLHTQRMIVPQEMQKATNVERKDISRVDEGSKEGEKEMG